VGGLFGFRLEHRLRSAALRSADGKRDHAGDRQTMPVLHGGMAHIAEPHLAADFLGRRPARNHPLGKHPLIVRTGRRSTAGLNESAC
jgi:hypothetical protein